MFAQLGIWLNSFLTGYVVRVVSGMEADIVAVATIALTFIIALYGLAMARGETTASMGVFSWTLIKRAAIIAVAGTSSIYMTNVVTMVMDLQVGLSTLFMPTTPGAPAPTTVFGVLDASYNRADELLKLLWKDASPTRLDLVLASLLFVIGTDIFSIAALIVMVVASTVLTWVLALGPIFILLLIHERTARFFESWLSFVASALLVSSFVFFALGLSFFVFEQLITLLRSSGAFSVTGVVNAVSAASTYLVFSAALAYVLLHAHEYASALTGGAAIQTGTGMISSYVGMRLMQRASGGGRSGGGGEGGGSVKGGAGLGYLAGRTAGLAMRSAGSAARSAYRRVAARAMKR